MSERFIKYIPSERSEWLRNRSHSAFLLLSQIAERARRFNGHPDEFEIGWALLGDYENAGLTRQQYRTAIAILELHKFIEIIYRGRKDKKSTIKPTIKRAIKGTIVKLIDSSIWDINPESYEQQPTIKPTINQPRTRMKKEELIGLIDIKENDKSFFYLDRYGEIKSLGEEDIKKILQDFQKPIIRKVIDSFRNRSNHQDRSNHQEKINDIEAYLEKCAKNLETKYLKNRRANENPNQRKNLPRKNH